MTSTTASNSGSYVQPLDDYDDAEEPSYEPTIPIQSRPARPQGRYEEDDQEDEEYEGYEAQGAEVSVSPRRAVALGVSLVALVAIFGVAIWLFLSRQMAPPTGPIAGVPTITGFNPTTQSENQQPVVGSYAPDFMWQENGKTVSLSSFRGKLPVFINFWGTWCPPCRAEMPEMEKSYTKHFGQIEVIGVSMTPGDTASLVLNFVNDHKYNWKFVHDGDYSIATRYQVANVPSSFFIGTDGIVKAVQVGAMLNGTLIESYMTKVIGH